MASFMTRILIPEPQIFQATPPSTALEKQSAAKGRLPGGCQVCTHVLLAVAAAPYPLGPKQNNHKSTKLVLVRPCLTPSSIFCHNHRTHSPPCLEFTTHDHSDDPFSSAHVLIQSASPTILSRCTRLFTTNIVNTSPLFPNLLLSLSQRPDIMV